VGAEAHVLPESIALRGLAHAESGPHGCENEEGGLDGTDEP
jgi:hypothetical protein